ncbi:MAG: hypothetical protein U9Q69_01845, partial [Nanoarchaeota archaeon]|nr:hypothetical protein [Nanoarchaeota archaeon]
MNRKSLLFLVIFILSISLATAVELEIEHSGQDYVPTGAEANFEVSVKNLGYRTEIFNVHSDPMANLPSSIFEYILIDNNRLELQSQETIKINIKVKLKKDIKSDENYGTYIMFETPDNKFKKKHNFILRVVPPEDLVVLKVSAPNKVKPKSLYQFSVELENNLNAKLQNVKLLISSELFNEEKELRLFPLQQRTETFSFSIDAGALPKDYDLSIRVVYNDEILKQAVSKFQVLDLYFLKLEIW